MKELSRKVVMLCPVCGNDQFESLDEEFENLLESSDEARLKCSDCESIFTKEELIRENYEKIDIAVEDVIKDVSRDFENELKKVFKK